MTHTVFVAIFAPLATVGMMLVIMWSMSVAGMPRKEYGQDTSEQTYSHPNFLENLVLIDGADRESATHKPGVAGGEAVDARSIDQSICILRRLDASNQRQVARMVNDLVLKELIRLSECETNTSR